MANEFMFKIGDYQLKIEQLKAARLLIDAVSAVSNSAPGAGAIEINAIEVLPRDAMADSGARYRARVGGRNIAQVYAQVWLREGGNLAGPLRTEYLQSPREREVKGIRHPRWSDQNEIEFTIPGVAAFIDCAGNSTLVCVRAERYAAALGTQVWSTEGLYQRGGGEPFRVQLDFNDTGDLIRKTGFYPVADRGISSPFDLIFEEGDTFEPFITVINAKGESTPSTSAPLVVKEGNPLRLTTSNLGAQDFIVAVQVEDFDGQRIQRF